MVNNLISKLAAATPELPGGNAGNLYLFLVAAANAAADAAAAVADIGLPGVLFVSPLGNNATAARNTLRWFLTIDAAWAAAQSGDLIVVLPGTYGRATLLATEGKDGITLQGWGNPLIATDDAANPALLVASLLAASNGFLTSMRVEGLRIENPSGNALVVLGPSSSSGRDVFGVPGRGLLLNNITVAFGEILLQCCGNVQASALRHTAPSALLDVKTLVNFSIYDSVLAGLRLDFDPSFHFSSDGRGVYALRSGTILVDTLTLLNAPNVVVDEGVDVGNDLVGQSLANFFSSTVYDLAPNLRFEGDVENNTVYILPEEAGGAAVPVAQFRGRFYGNATFSKINAGLLRRTIDASGAWFGATVTTRDLCDLDLMGARLPSQASLLVIGAGTAKRVIAGQVTSSGGSPAPVVFSPPLPAGTTYGVQLSADTAAVDPTWSNKTEAGFDVNATAVGAVDSLATPLN